MPEVALPKKRADYDGLDGTKLVERDGADHEVGGGQVHVFLEGRL